MEWLNYHHLLYFSVIARRGSLARAAEELAVTHSTLSAQLRALEGFLGGELFERRGRGLVLTPFGAEVASYASDIFRTGAELVEVARGRKKGGRGPLGVGAVGNLPKSVVFRLLEPALLVDPDTVLDVRQDRAERLLEELAAGRLHIVLSDAPPRAPSLHLHTRLLGESGVLLYATRALAARHRGPFPSRCDGAPLILPRRGPLRGAMERWFAEQGIRMNIVGELDDAGLLRVLGLHGRGVFPVRAALRTEVDEGSGAICIGTMEGVRERYYATSVERRSRHPGVVAIIENAQATLLAPTPRGTATATARRRTSRAGKA